MQINQILEYDNLISSGKRSRLAAYYTPLDIALIMVRDAIKARLVLAQYSERESDDFLAGNLPDLAEQILLFLQDLQIIDMAAGTGVFFYAYLLKIRELLRLYDSDLQLADFTINMVANDIDAEALALFPKLLAAEFKIVYKGILLKEDALLELRKAEVIKSIVVKAGFDIIFGNPPYLGEKNNQELFAQLKKDAVQSKYYQGKMDYYYFFIHQAIDWLKKDGVISYLTPAYFMTADGADLLRTSLKEKMDFLVVRKHKNAFKTAKGVEVLSFLLAHKSLKAVNCQVFEKDNNFSISSAKLFGSDGQIRLIANQYQLLLQKIERACHYRLGKRLVVRQGLVSGADKFSPKMLQYLDNARVGEPIFVFQEKPLWADSHLKVLHKNSDIKAYKIVKKSQQWIIYSREDRIKSNPQALEYLARFKKVLEQRREVKTGKIKWYELQWPRQEAMFSAPKILVPQRSRLNTFAYSEDTIYASADIYYLLLRADYQKQLRLSVEVYLKAITVYLNSSIVFFWLYFMGKRKGKMLELYSTPLSKIPLPDFSDDLLLSLADKFQQYIVNKNASIMFEIDMIIAKEIDLSVEEIEFIYNFSQKSRHK